MGFKVADEFRTHPWSLVKGGQIVVVEMEDGSILEYSNIKNLHAYMKTTLKNPIVKRAYIK